MNARTAAPARPSMLLVDDDDTFRQLLARVMEKRGFTVTTAHGVDSALRAAAAATPDYAVIDLNMPGPSGLVLVQKLSILSPGTRIVVLTGYGSIATAVEAIKLGATHYLAKPADADEILAAFHRDDGDAGLPPPATPPSIKRLEWEHIQKVLSENQGNISAAARMLHMHRRTLQRKLGKRPVRK